MKTRCWNPVLRKWEDGYFITQDEKVYTKHTENEDTESFFVYHPAWILQYSTGLKDKHGCVIFEGDIIELNNHKGRVTRSRSGMWVVVFDDLKVKPLMKIDHREIIGNIFENSELFLEDK